MWFFRRRQLGDSYYKKVLRSGPITFWPFDELAGSVAYDHAGNSLHGAYTGVTLGQPGVGDGKTAPYTDGANDMVNITSAGLISRFDGTEGSLAIWIRTTAAAWSDSTVRLAFTLYSDAANYIYLRKSATFNQLDFFYEAGDVVYSHTTTSLAGTTDWFHALLTWSLTDDALISYLDGAQLTTSSSLGTWVGDLNASATLILAHLVTPSSVWLGWGQYAAIWDRALTPAEAADLAIRPRRAA